MRFVSIDGNWAIYWRKLDGLLTETGYSVDGNWIFCWRKLVYWRKLDGLLTETRRFTDGKSMACWRILDDLLTETGCFIDGNWMERVQSVYGNSPADFLYFGGLKMRFIWVLKPTVSGTPSIHQLISTFWRVRNAIFAQSWNPGFKCTKLRVSKFSAFWQRKNAICTDSWKEKWHFLASNIQKIRWRRLRVLETVGFRTLKKSYFHAPKIKRIWWNVSINRLHSFRQ